MDAGSYNPLKKGFEDVILPEPGKPWGGLWKYDNYSRWSIQDDQFDDVVNWLPMGESMRQLPANGTTIATLASTITWMTALTLNSASYIFALCANGNIYQTSTGGSITTVGTGFSQFCDITSWQGTNILISDFTAQKIYNWNGSTLSTVFSSQPANFIQVFSGRLWMANGNTITFTAAGTFNSLGGDAGSFTIGDFDTPPSILAMVPFLGQLYVFGPSWIQTIGNLFDSGSPAVLQFQRYTMEDQVGPINKWSIIPYGAYLYFANASGFWRLEGLDPKQISQRMDGFFQNFGAASTFSAAFAYIYSMPCVMWHADWVNDAFNGEIYIYTNENEWCRATDGGYTFICDTVVVSTGLQTAFATTGTAIFQLFSNTTTAVTSVINSKFWNFGHPILDKKGIYFGVTYVLTGQATCTVAIQNQQAATQLTNIQSATASVIWQNNSGQVVSWQNNSNQTVGWSGMSVQFFIHQFAFPIQFKAFGVQITVVGAGTTFVNIVMQYKRLASSWLTNN